MKERKEKEEAKIELKLSREREWTKMWTRAPERGEVGGSSFHGEVA